MKSFSQFLNEKNTKIATFTFGRFQPPTIGHMVLLDKVSEIAGSGDMFIYSSQSVDNKKNPLDYLAKIKFLRKMFPKYARSIILDKNIKMVFDALVSLYEKDYTEINMVVGSDRVTEFQTLANKYNGVKARHGLYNFEKGVNVISAGDRDPDGEGVSGISATKMRVAAEDADLSTWNSGLPSGFKGATELLNAVRRGMGLSEEKNFRAHIKLEPTSEAREAYVEGTLFNKGDEVIINENEVVTVCTKGTNYLILETSSGKKVRKWIEDVTPLNQTQEYS